MERGGCECGRGVSGGGADGGGGRGGVLWAEVSLGAEVLRRAGVSEFGRRQREGTHIPVLRPVPSFGRCTAAWTLPGAVRAGWCVSLFRFAARRGLTGVGWGDDAE
ncbi:hypothetical protein GCM10023259_051980 [Thermocatellispora tengchongensis]